MMGQEHYCLKWNHHWANLVGVFNSLLQTETFVDVTLACDGHNIKAHRLVLSACSPYFTKLLQENPDRHPVIIVKGVKYAHVKALVHFIYNGEVAIDQKDLPDLIAIAREFQVRGLADRNLQEEQLKLAAAQSLSKAEKEAEISSSSLLYPGGTLPLKVLTGGAYAVPVDSTAQNGPPSDLSNERNKSSSPTIVVSEPLSLVTSDQPTDLTSASKQQNYREPSSPYNGQRVASPSRKRRKLSMDGEEESAVPNGGDGARTSREDDEASPEVSSSETGSSSVAPGPSHEQQHNEVS